jgi:hypothetical protein
MAAHHDRAAVHARLPGAFGRRRHPRNYGWRCVPQEPTPEPGWEIFDSSPDYKTGWQRRVFTVAGQIWVLLSECAIYIGQEGLFQESGMDDRGDCRGGE